MPSNIDVKITADRRDNAHPGPVRPMSAMGGKRSFKVSIQVDLEVA